MWKKLGIKGQVLNYSTKTLWVLENDSGKPRAHKLPAGFRTLPDIDFDALNRVDGVSVEGHNNWWKFYDFSNAEVFDASKNKLKISAISKTAVPEGHFNKVKYLDEITGRPLQVIVDVKRDKRKKIISYFVTELGWLSFEKTLELTCLHQIDNARPVFPAVKSPYIRTRKDIILPNNLSQKGTT
jgi:hypothetical protein